MIKRQDMRALKTSASLLVSLAAFEGFVSVAEPPIPGDRSTYGFGMTWRPDGSPVQTGDKIDPVTALRQKYEYVTKDKSRLDGCVTSPVLPGEAEALQDHAYHNGVAATCSSTLVALTNAGEYDAACQQHLEWRFISRRSVQTAPGWKPSKTRKNVWVFDCAQYIGDDRNRTCWGMWERAQHRYNICMGAA